MADLTEAIGAALAAWVRAVLVVPKTTIVVALAVAAAAGYYAVRNLGVNTDAANMISAELPWRQDFNAYREAFPARDRNLVIVIDATTPEGADEYARALASRLRAAPELYKSVFLAGDGEFFERNGLLYLSVAELEQLTDRLAAAQPLLGLLERDCSGAGVLDVAARTLGAAPNDAAGALTPFYTELADALRAAGSPDGAADPVSWSALLGRGMPSTRRLIVLQPELDFGSMRPASAAMSGIRTLAAELNAGLAEPVRVRLTGTVAMEHEELASVSQGAGLAALATFAMVALVLYAALRSFRLLAICLVTLVAGLLLAGAFAAAAVGSLNLISIAFVVLNVGLGSDYVIHFSLRQKELMADGMPVGEALVETARGVGASLALCAVTTAAGFYSFIPTKFEGVSELGLIAGTGVFFSLLMSVTLLPALAAVLVRADPARAARTWLGSGGVARLVSRPRAVLSVTLLVGLGTFGALPWVTFDSNPIHLRDPRSESVETLADIAQSGDAQILNLVAIAPDSATARRWAADLAALPAVASVITPDSLVPPNQPEKVAVLEDAALLLGNGFAALERRPLDPAALFAALEGLSAAKTEDPAARELQAAARELLGRARSLPPDEQRTLLQELDDSLTASLPRELARLEAALTAEPFTRAELPPSLAERWLAGNRELIEIVPAEDVSDNGAAERFVDAVRSVVPTATGLPVVYEEASRTVVSAFATALTYALVMVTIIVWVFLRKPQHVLLVIVPILLATGVTAGVTVLIDMPWNYANVIALPLLVGLGVDNGIHVVHRIHTDGFGARLFESSTLRGVLASGLTTIASFGNLAFSSHVGTASMGKLLAIGLVISMAATLIVLPAWLEVFGRRQIARAQP